MNKMSPKERVFAIVARIPRGKVSTYAAVARMAGIGGARPVGNILHTNKNSSLVPCHRVVNRKGELARNFGMGGAEVQAARLVAEGVEVVGEKVDLGMYFWEG